MSRGIDVGRRRWAPAKMTTSTIRAGQEPTCRVCGETIAAGVEALFRTWGVEYAHPACGWDRPKRIVFFATIYRQAWDGERFVRTFGPFPSASEAWGKLGEAMADPEIKAECNDAPIGKVQESERE